MRKNAFILSGIALVVLVASQVQGQGHRIDNAASQVVVDRASHWNEWTFANGTIDLSTPGVVKPRRWARNTNSMLNIVEFLQARPPDYIKKEPEEIVLQDAIQGGSNIGDVVNAIDGDESTYWEPDAPTSATDVSSQWWFTIDLGRIVVLNKVVVKFVDEDVGDPFLLFDVLVSDGQRPTAALGSASLDYIPILQTLKPNKNQREFSVDLSGRDAAAREAAARFIQIVVRGSDLDRGREVSKERYAELGEDQGLIEYNKLLADGRETAVSEAVYNELEPARQGNVLYFKRERPRLAELEVWGDGDEIVIDALNRGGLIDTPGQLTPDVLLDGDVFSAISLDITRNDFRIDEIFIDLGSTFWVDGQRMITNFRNSGHAWSLGNHRVQLSDGSLQVNGDLKWTTVANVERESKAGLGASGSLLLIERHDFDLVKARFFRLAFEVLGGGGGRKAYIGEIQLFGSGFQPEASVVSDLIRLGGSRNLIAIEWEADTPPGTQVVLQTRTGDTLTEVFHYFRKDGKPVEDLAAYNKLPKSFKGEITSSEIEGPDWSLWSEPYENAAGSPITSPSPRTFLKIGATLLSDSPDVAAELKSIRLHFANPVAQQLLGELTPTQVDSLGVERPFSLYVQPQMNGSNLGFDELLLTAPTGMELDFAQIYGGRSQDFFVEDGDMNELQWDNVEVIPTASDSLHVRFPAIDSGDGVDLLRLDFNTTLFAMGGLLKASLRKGDASSPGGGFWQRVDAGEASVEVGNNTMVLVAQPQNREIFKNVAFPSRVFTPNGDGANDVLRLQFDVVLVGTSSAVEVDIYDLSGRRIQRITQQRAVSVGSYEVEWDGRDAGGEIVPPGMYAMILTLDTDTQGADLKSGEIVRTIAVAY